MSETETPARGGAAAGLVAVTFALPDESRPFTRSLDGPPTARQGCLPVELPNLNGRLVQVIHTGVGETSAGRQRLLGELASEVVAAAGNDEPCPYRFLVAAGYAGGVAPQLAVGDLVLGKNFSDPALLARAQALLASEPLHVGCLITRDRVAETAAAKSALAAETGALAVDMETAWIAEVCRQSQIPMLSLRVISDAADQDFPVPGHVLFDSVRQRPRYLALPAWLLAHPRRIAPFAAFVRGLNPARERLARALRTLVAHA